MFLVTGKEMAEIDKLVIEKWKIPELILMENAGMQVVRIIKQKLGDLQGRKITIIVGKGNNGGDGLVIARHLCNLGADVKVFLISTNFRGAAQINYNIAKKLPIKWYELDNKNSLHVLKLSLYYTEVIVDALLGTGLKGQVYGIGEKVIQIVNSTKCWKIAVDIPSGLEADTGKVKGPCIKADQTVTFALPKIGLVVPPGISYVGELNIVDISFPRDIYQDLKINRYLLNKDKIRNFLPKREPDCYKNTFGHVLVIGGSRNMMGAVHLAASGALKMGAGLVSAAIPKSIQGSLASSLPEMITYPVPENEQGTLGLVSGKDILENLENKKVIVFGPGMGKNSEIGAFLKWLLEKTNIPFVIDADGLNALSTELDILKDVQSPVVLTPHPGEMARLLNVSTQEIQENRIDLAHLLAVDYGVWVVLKGYKTIIATPQGEIFVNPTGSPALATAGTGDILAGMIGAMIGQINNITDAICSAVYLHGLAGEIVSYEIGDISSKARDILKAIPKAIKEVAY